jgi:hypothetical protein
MKKRGNLRPTEVGTFTTPFLHLSYKIKNVLGNSQIFVKLFF